jgi:hypothetical protein
MSDDISVASSSSGRMITRGLRTCLHVVPNRHQDFKGQYASFCNPYDKLEKAYMPHQWDKKRQCDIYKREASHQDQFVPQAKPKS